MSEWDQIARYRPATPPYFVHPTRASALRDPYIACWINSAGVAVALSRRGCHLRKSALALIRSCMHDGSSPEMNKADRYYIWDSSFVGWNPHNLNCWTPVAERPRDQWVPNR